MDGNVAGYLQLYAIVIAFIRPAIMLALLSGLWFALRRTTLSPSERSTAWLAVAVPLLLWLAVIWNLSVSGTFQARPGATSPIPIAVAIPVLTRAVSPPRSTRHRQPG